MFMNIRPKLKSDYILPDILQNFSTVSSGNQLLIVSEIEIVISSLVLRHHIMTELII